MSRLVIPPADFGGYVRRGDWYLSSKDIRLWLADAELASTDEVAKQVLAAIRNALTSVEES